MIQALPNIQYYSTLLLLMAAWRGKEEEEEEGAAAAVLLLFSLFFLPHSGLFSTSSSSTSSSVAAFPNIKCRLQQPSVPPSVRPSYTQPSPKVSLTLPPSGRGTTDGKTEHHTSFVAPSPQASSCLLETGYSIGRKERKKEREVNCITRLWSRRD